MLHHVTLEIRSEDVPAAARFWAAAGFSEVPPAPALGEGFTWFEREGTQIHLQHVGDPVVPSRGHAAIVAPDFDETVARIESEGFRIEPSRDLWGAKRAKATLPSGHVVELMEFPPGSRPPRPGRGVQPAC